LARFCKAKRPKNRLFRLAAGAGAPGEPGGAGVCSPAPAEEKSTRQLQSRFLKGEHSHTIYDLCCVAACPGFSFHGNVMIREQDLTPEQRRRSRRNMNALNAANGLSC
jgi:hypothetical protein